jgi:hypothetical protein
VNDLIISTAINTIIALLIGWLVVLVGTKILQNRSQRTAHLTLKFILMILSILSIPIIANYAINGIIVTWALPNFLLSFLGVFFLVQTLVIAIIGLLLVGVSAIIDQFKHISYVH